MTAHTLNQRRLLYLQQIQVTAARCTTGANSNNNSKNNSSSYSPAPNADMNMSNKTKITACQNFLMAAAAILLQERTRKIDDNERSFANGLFSCCDRPQVSF
jgi:hypothetical protein